MKIAIIILLIGALGAGVCNYFCKNNKENKMETPMLESAKGVDLYGDDEYVFLDVRTLNEHRAKAIPNSPVIPVQELESRVNELNKYKDKKIVVYCRSGNRSKRGTDILINHGFDAENLEGGMNKWQGAVISSE